MMKAIAWRVFVRLFHQYFWNPAAVKLRLEGDRLHVTLKKLDAASMREIPGGSYSLPLSQIRVVHSSQRQKDTPADVVRELKAWRIPVRCSDWDRQREEEEERLFWDRLGMDKLGRIPPERVSELRGEELAAIVKKTGWLCWNTEHMHLTLLNRRLQIETFLPGRNSRPVLRYRLTLPLDKISRILADRPVEELPEDLAAGFRKAGIRLYCRETATGGETRDWLHVTAEELVGLLEEDRWAFRMLVPKRLLSQPVFLEFAGELWPDIPKRLADMKNRDPAKCVRDPGKVQIMAFQFSQGYLFWNDAETRPLYDEECVTLWGELTGKALEASGPALDKLLNRTDGRAYPLRLSPES